MILRLVQQGVQAWCRQAGYTRLTAFMPQAAYDHERFRRYIQHGGFQPIARRKYQIPFVEIAVDLMATAGRSDADWATWTERPPLPGAAEIP